jgi:hypothetical protein
MNWQWPLIAYLTIGILLGEGLIYNGKKTKTPVTIWQYLVALLLGPIFVWPILILQTLRKKPK